MQALRLKSWSPYVVGALIGVLSWFSFASVDKPLGITTAFEYTAALAIRGVDPRRPPRTRTTRPHPVHEAELEGKEPKIDWEWMLVLGCGDRCLRQLAPVGRPRNGRAGAAPVARALRRQPRASAIAGPSSAAGC